MTLGRGINWIYGHMTNGLPEESVDEIDAVLGDEGAARRVRGRSRRANQAALATADVEIG